MLRHLKSILTAVAVCALCVGLSPATSVAGTILEMNLGNVVNDIEYDGTTLRTTTENVATTGDQDTGVQFLGILDPLFTDILTTNQASFTLSGLVPDGQASLIVNSVIIQNFKNGIFELYGNSGNNLLLKGNLGNSALSGSLNNTTGGLFQTTLGTATGGSLMGLIDPSSISLSMNFTAIADTPSGLPGLRVSPLPGGPINFFLTNLSPFRADATVNIEANVPEPGSVMLVFLGGAIAMATGRRFSRSFSAANLRSYKYWGTARKMCYSVKIHFFNVFSCLPRHIG